MAAFMSGFIDGLSSHPNAVSHLVVTIEGEAIGISARLDQGQTLMWEGAISTETSPDEAKTAGGHLSYDLLLSKIMSSKPEYWR